MLAEVGLVTLVAVLLIVGGIALFGLTIWFWKTSRPEPPALARLEVMSERAYRKSRGVDRQFLLKMAEREAREAFNNSEREARESATISPKSSEPN